MYSVAQVADMLGVSKETLRRWDNSGKLPSLRNPMNNYRFYHKDQLRQFEELHFIFDDSERLRVAAAHPYTAIELFAGGGGLAIGLERAGLHTVLLNEVDKHACATLKTNRPHWHVHCGDIGLVDFSPYLNQIDVLTGGFPCQAFSYAGKKMGFEDACGTLFYEFARAVKETRPKLFMAENVRGLLTHDGGATLKNMRSVLDELGYTLLEPHLMKAIFYRVPQKRERLLLVGIRHDLAGLAPFHWPRPYQKVYTLKDALKAGELFPCDAPESLGQGYPAKKAAIMAQVPPGGYWRDLPEDLQKQYMQKSYFFKRRQNRHGAAYALGRAVLDLNLRPGTETDRTLPSRSHPPVHGARIRPHPNLPRRLAI